MREKRFSLSSTPELLAITPRALVGQFLFGSPCSRWIFSDEVLVDTPTQKGCNVVPVGVGRRTSDLITADSLLKMARVLARMCETCNWPKLSVGSSRSASHVIHSLMTPRALRW
jgi:hypothetical protein